MTNQPIVPTPKLIQQWGHEWNEEEEGDDSLLEYVATHAAQWGADQELEACRMEIIDGAGLFYIDETSDRVRLAEDIWTARRPKPPSLKEQALEALERQCLRSISPLVSTSDLDTIRRALEALPND